MNLKLIIGAIALSTASATDPTADPLEKLRESLSALNVAEAAAKIEREWNTTDVVIDFNGGEIKALSSEVTPTREHHESPHQRKKREKRAKAANKHSKASSMSFPTALSKSGKAKSSKSHSISMSYPAKSSKSKSSKSHSISMVSVNFSHLYLVFVRD